MTSPMRISRKGLELIKSFEGFRPRAARLADGRWTIGYGHVRSARKGAQVSKRDAEHLLRYDLQRIEAAVTEWTLTPLNQNEFDALVSLVFNISPGQFRDSEVVRRLNAGDHIAAANAFDAWRRARVNGRLIVVDALVRRRTAEKALFLEPIDRRPAAPTPIITPEIDVTAAITAPKDAPVHVSTDLSSEKAEAVADVEQPFLEEAELSRAVETLVETDAALNGPSPALDPQAAAAAVSERISQILQREPSTSSLARQGAAKQDEAATLFEGSENEIEPEIDPEAEKKRILIDDTEIYDPGFEKAVSNSIGRDDLEGAKPSNGFDFLPWGVVALGALILMALGGGDFLRILREGADAGPAGPRPMIFILGALSFVMSLYFWIGRSVASRSS
ncbi:MAG: lysozyme [Pseudomonadota bacterium]